VGTGCLCVDEGSGASYLDLMRLQAILTFDSCDFSLSATSSICNPSFAPHPSHPLCSRPGHSLDPLCIIQVIFPLLQGVFFPFSTRTSSRRSALTVLPLQAHSGLSAATTSRLCGPGTSSVSSTRKKAFLDLLSCGLWESGRGCEAVVRT
jgi:hypothetical protein